MNVSEVINALHNPVSEPQRSGKDLSHRKVFSLKVGELLPVLCEEMVPKDYFEIDIASLVRSLQPLNTAAFMRAKLHFDFFFVPMTSIWRNFDNFYYQREDNYTSYRQGSAYEPNATLIALSEYATHFTGSGSGFNRSSPAARQKLLQLLGYGRIYGDKSKFQSGGVNSSIAYNTLTVLPLYAYNRIYNLHYRDPWRDAPGSYDRQSMSADNVPCQNFGNSLVSRDGLDGVPNLASPTDCRELLNMRYHKYPMDLFMGLLPSQQFGSVASVNIQGTIVVNGTTSSDKGRWVSNDLNSWASRFTVKTASTAGPNTSLVADNGDPSLPDLQHDHTTSATVVLSTQNTGYPNFDVLTLRRALATQKWAEYNARAGWKSGKQAKAMFGVNEATDLKHDIHFIDSYQFPIMVDEVVAQSTDGSSSSKPNGTLGELGGKVIGVGNGHKIKFSSGDRFGYLMCIAYVLPQVDYNAKGISKMLVRSTPEQHFMPAYQNLGLEAVHRYELNASDDAGSQSTFNAVLGYTTRYHEYKTRVDQVFMDFMSGDSLDAWVVARKDLENASLSGGIPASLLYVSPTVMDSVFAVSADNSTSTDHFMINANFSIKAVRPMSDLGLPTM